MAGFEGSYMGAADRISPRAVMECKICWTPYDPAEGDPTRQIDAGTAFADLPEDWTCPTCSGAREQFMVRADPGAADAINRAEMDARVAALAADFTEVWHAKMRDVPVVNKALRVQTVGFRAHGEDWLGVLIAPWFMNLVLLPGPGRAWDDLRAGEKEVVHFPSGAYEFLHNSRETVGGYKACSLFSPMAEFGTQGQAVEVAQAVMVALFDPANTAETDRGAEIRAARETALAAAAEDPERGDHADEPGAPAPSRRGVISAGLAR